MSRIAAALRAAAGVNLTLSLWPSDRQLMHAQRGYEHYSGMGA